MSSLYLFILFVDICWYYWWLFHRFSLVDFSGCLNDSLLFWNVFLRFSKVLNLRFSFVCFIFMNSLYISLGGSKLCIIESSFSWIALIEIIGELFKSHMKWVLKELAGSWSVKIRIETWFCALVSFHQLEIFFLLLNLLAAGISSQRNTWNWI